MAASNSQLFRQAPFDYGKTNQFVETKPAQLFPLCELENRTARNAGLRINPWDEFEVLIVAFVS